MENEVTPKADSQSANEPVKVDLNASRNAIYEKFKLQSATPAVKEEPVADTDIKESESESAPVSADDSGSSSVKEDQVPAKPVSDKEQNVTKALHEEREKRKEANRRLKDIQAQYDEKIKALQAKVEELARPKEQSYDSPDEQLKAENARLRREREEEQKRRQHEEAINSQVALNTRIKTVTKALKEEGFPGFEYALAKVDAAIAKRIEDGDILPEDASKSETWKKVYMEDVYSDFAAEFKQINKVESVEKKLLAKQKAKLIGTPGSNPVQESSKETEDESMASFNKKYFENRNKKNFNRG